jgi:ABA4-like protein
MDPDRLFSICGAAVVPGWLLLVVAPRWRPTRLLIRSGLLSLMLAVVYLALVLRYFPGAAGGFGSLAEVARLFQSRPLLLAGWIHYLAFDLFVGAWETTDAEARGVPHLLVVP